MAPVSGDALAYRGVSHILIDGQANGHVLFRRETCVHDGSGFPDNRYSWTSGSNEM
jgi:hypothetical protein